MHTGRTTALSWLYTGRMEGIRGRVVSAALVVGGAILGIVGTSFATYLPGSVASLLVPDRVLAQAQCNPQEAEKDIYFASCSGFF